MHSIWWNDWKYLAYKNMSWPTIISVVHKRKQRRHEGEGGLCTLVGGGGGLPSWKILPSWLPVSFDSSTFCWLAQRSLLPIAVPKRNFFCGCVLSNWSTPRQSENQKLQQFVLQNNPQVALQEQCTERTWLFWFVRKSTLSNFVAHSEFLFFFCSTASNLEFDLVSTAFSYS